MPSNWLVFDRIRALARQGRVFTDPTKIDLQEAFAARGGPGLLMPMALAPVELPETSAQRQIDSYTLRLGGIPISQGRPW